MDRINVILDGLRTYWENLTARERMLLSVLGGVIGLVIVLTPVYLLTSSIGDLEEDNAEIATALRRISRSRDQIAARRAEQTERDARYSLGAPGNDFLTTHAERHGLVISRSTEQPDRTQGRFTIHTNTATFTGIGLRPAMLMLADLKNSRYPVAISKLHIDHHTAGDRYNMEVGVMTFAREGAGGPDAGVAQPADQPAGARRPAGPPAR